MSCSCVPKYFFVCLNGGNVLEVKFLIGQIIVYELFDSDFLGRQVGSTLFVSRCGTLHAEGRITNSGAIRSMGEVGDVNGIVDLSGVDATACEAGVSSRKLRSPSLSS